jgi:hypothetical protein
MLREIGAGRGRLRAALKDAAESRVTLVSAPYGYGKTSVLLDYAGLTEAAYVAVEENMSLLGFAGSLVEAIASRAEGIERTLTAAHARSLQMPDPPAALATWFVRHLDDEPFTIVVDDLHAAEGASVAAFVSHAIDLSPPGCKWIVASESLDDLPVARWLAHETAAYPLLQNTFLLTIREALASALYLSPSLTVAQVLHLHAECRGVPSLFAYCAATLQHDPGIPLAEVCDVAAAFARLDDAQQGAVLTTSLLPELDDASLELCAGARAREIVTGLRETHPAFFEWHGRNYHSYVRPQLIAGLAGSPFHRDAVRGTANVYQRDGNVARALRLLGTIGDEDEMLRIIEHQGFASLDRDAAHGLRDAVRTLSYEAREKSPAVLTVMALTAALEGHGDICESLFQNAMVACSTARERWFVRYRYSAELIRRGRGEDALKLLTAEDELEAMLVPFRGCVEAALAVAHAVCGSNGEAHAHTERALSLILQEPDPAAEARIRHQAAYVALAGGEYERAKELARQSARLAASCGLAEVQGGALTVLYNVLADVDEDTVAAIDALRRIAVCGGKAGSIELQFYGLVGAYELEVERGDDAALVPLEAAFHDFEVHYGEPIAMQGLLPSQVLRLAWGGEFWRAWRILKPSAAEESDPIRRALRWAEVSLYAACSGDVPSAVAALAEVRRCSRDCDFDSAQTQRVATMRALTLTLLGKCRAGSAAAGRLLEVIPKERHRTCAFAAAVGALAEWRLGRAGSADLLHALGALYEHDLGGIARLLESLPPRCVAPLTARRIEETAA